MYRGGGGGGGMTKSRRRTRRRHFAPRARYITIPMRDEESLPRPARSARHRSARQKTARVRLNYLLSLYDNWYARVRKMGSRGRPSKQSYGKKPCTGDTNEGSGW